MNIYSLALSLILFLSTAPLHLAALQTQSQVMTKNQKSKAEEQKPKAEDLIPIQLTLRGLQAAAADCKACDLWLRGTQTVFGEGRRRARIMFIGEQPGNEEDLSGKPFVGPAGRLLDAALQEAGIDRSQTYVTNVVKLIVLTLSSIFANIR